MLLEEKQGFNNFSQSYFNPYGQDPRIKVNLP